MGIGIEAVKCVLQEICSLRDRVLLTLQWRDEPVERPDQKSPGTARWIEDAQRERFVQGPAGKSGGKGLFHRVIQECRGGDDKSCPGIRAVNNDRLVSSGSPYRAGNVPVEDAGGLFK